METNGLILMPARGIVADPAPRLSAVRMATTGERATWQTRRDQHTVGRVWDDAYYYSH